MTDRSPCSCCAADTPDLGRRRVIRIAAAAGLASPFAALAAGDASGPQAGDRFVEEDAEGTPAPIKLSDLRPGKPVLAFPFDAKAKAARDGSRLNKVVLVRFAEGDLAAPARGRAAGGVVAYSAICTHQGCDVKTWLSKEQVLVCFCHSSKFQLLDDGQVASGPALRALPSLPIRLEGDELVAAGGFSAPPGGAV